MEMSRNFSIKADYNRVTIANGSQTCTLYGKHCETFWRLYESEPRPLDMDALSLSCGFAPNDIAFVYDKLKNLGVLDARYHRLANLKDLPHLLIPACSARSLDMAREIRKRYANIDTNNDLYYEEKEAIRDRTGYVFNTYRDFEIVGTLRMHPVQHGTSYLQEIGRLPAEMVMDPELCEASRFVIDPRYRGNGIQIVADLGDWMMNYTSIRHYIAICQRTLIPFYKRIGAKILIDNFALARTTVKDYALIYGEFAELAKRRRRSAAAYGT